MKLISEKRIEKLVKEVKNKKIAIIGDIMIDKYVWGSVNRISPEAPVPVVDIDHEMERLGGAANVGNNVAVMGGIPLVCGVIGKDNNASKMLSLFKEQNFMTEGIIEDKSRVTTVKTRVIANNQQVVRTDKESKIGIAKEIENKFLKNFEEIIPSVDGIIIEDYNKGLITEEIIKNVTRLARKYNKIITVDPKYNNFYEYNNVTVFKPNVKETEEAVGFKMVDDERVKVAGKMLMSRLNCENVIITRGSKGMMVFSGTGTINNIPTTARKVHDVSGAGDTVIAVLTMMLTAGCSIMEASTIANHAAGIVCSEVGVVPVEPEKLMETVADFSRKGKMYED